LAKSIANFNRTKFDYKENENQHQVKNVINNAKKSQPNLVVVTSFFGEQFTLFSAFFKSFNNEKFVIVTQINPYTKHARSDGRHQERER
jgi:hypothetical protein